VIPGFAKGVETMKRRELLFSMGAVALAASAERGLSQSMADMPGMDHSAAPKHQALIDAASKCSSAATVCVSHCVQMLAAGDKSLLACAATSREVEVVCEGLASLAAQDAPNLAKYAKVAGEICTYCEAECRKHPQHPPCMRCADACAACAKECGKVA
jgi:Cys-rich four helix bundle protein (predicted Tat secretion target)